MRIIGHFQERDLDDAISGGDFAQLSGLRSISNHRPAERSPKSGFDHDPQSDKTGWRWRLAHAPRYGRRRFG
jgi:hypothetical protein